MAVIVCTLTVLSIANDLTGTRGCKLKWLQRPDWSRRGPGIGKQGMMGAGPNCNSIIQFSSVAQSCPTLCDPMNRSTPSLPVHHQLPEFTQTHVHRVSDAIQPFHPLSSGDYLILQILLDAKFPVETTDQDFFFNGWNFWEISLVGYSYLCLVLFSSNWVTK